MTKRWCLLLLHAAALASNALSSSIYGSSILLSPRQSSDGAEIRVVSPPAHSWWTVDEVTGKLQMLVVRFSLRGFSIPADGYLRIGGVKVDGPKKNSVNTFIIRDSLNAFTMSNIEPGTYFFTLELIRATLSMPASVEIEYAVAETTLHVEVVSPRSSSPMVTHEEKTTYLPPQIYSVKLGKLFQSQSSIPICYVTSVGEGFDGQKKMWLQIIEALASPKNTSTGHTSINSSPRAPFTTNFRFEVVTFSRIVDDSPMSRSLAQLGITLRGGSPEITQFSLSALHAANVSPAGVEEAILESFYEVFPETKPRHDSLPTRLSPYDQRNLTRIEPKLVRDIWIAYVNELQNHCTDGVVLMGNSRFIADQAVVLAAQLAGVRTTVYELSNVFPPPMSVDVLFAPSHFALYHPSVVKNVRAKQSFVVSTGINIDVFTPAISQSPDKEFVVGYVGRLATDKSIGILVGAARLLREVCSFCKLRLIGDGELKLQLKSLAVEWNLLESSVEILDGIYNDETAIARELQKMHAYATPSFRETLGISVLEAMSVGLPVVGFIAGGTSEFLEDRYNCVEVKERSPEAFRDAILLLVNDIKIRDQLGRNARDTVTRRFARDASIGTIAALYKRFGMAVGE